MTLEDLTDRRLLPAVRRCISFSGRLEDLSQRVAWTMAFLRTRVDTALSQQNRDLLKSMDRRTQLQLRLQEIVEGLSVVAISYYLLSIVGYILRGVEHEIALSHDLAVAIVAPVVFLALWLIKYRIWQGLSDRGWPTQTQASPDRRYQESKKKLPILPFRQNRQPYPTRHDQKLKCARAPMVRGRPRKTMSPGST